MDYDSSDSDDDQNIHNRQFNARQTEAVVECVEWVLTVISKNSAESIKEVKIPIRKEKKEKLKKSKVTDVNQHIRALCDTFKSIPSSSRCPQLEVRGRSRHSKAVPVTNRHSEAIPGTSKHNEAVPGPSRHSEAIPVTFRHNEAVPGSSRHSEAVPGTSRHSKAIPGTSIHNQAVPEPSRDSKAITGNSRPNIETAPVSLKHGTERVVPETSSFKKQSEDITKKHTDTESFGAGPKTATSSAIEDHGTSENCTNATSGIPRTHVEVATGSSRTHSERSKFSTSHSNVAEPRTHIKTVPDISGSTTKTMPGTSKNPSTKAPVTSNNNPENVAESSKSFTDALKETSKTLTEAHNRTAEIPIVVGSGVVLKSSLQNMETEISGTPASRSDQSDVTKSGTSGHTEVVVPGVPNGSTKTMSGASKSPMETGPEISKQCPNNVVTETSARFVKPVEEISKSRTETTNPIISRNHTELMVSGTTGSCTADRETAESHTKDHHGTVESRTKAVSEKSEKHVIVGPATKTVISETMPGTTRNGSNAELHWDSSSKAVTESSESNNIAVEYNSLHRHDEAPPTEGNSQICTKIKVATTESEEINNNIAATKRNTEKRKHTNSIDDGPKRARIDDKCTLCGKSISNEEFAKHYKEQHGIHHEIQHNNRNFENKIQDLDKRLHNTNENKTNNEQNYKITVDSKKRTAARSSSAPNEDTIQDVVNSTLGIIANSDDFVEPEEKKKRTSTRSVSAPNERIEQQTSSTILKEGTNQNKVLDASVIDLTEDDDLGEPKPSTNITVPKCSPKPADDYQILNDSQFIDPSNDTSLYEPPGENETKIAEAFLLENVKAEKAANNQLDNDIEVVSDVFPTLSNTEKPSDIERYTTAKQSTEQIIKGIDQRDSFKNQNDSGKIVSETPGRGIGIIPGFPISNTIIKDETSINILDLGTASHSQASKPKISKQPNSARQHTSNTNKLISSFPGLSITVSSSKDSVPNSSLSVSLPHSTTITPIPVTQIASKSSAVKHSTNASTDVAQLGTSSRSTPNTKVSPNITTSLSVHSALKQQSLPSTSKVPVSKSKLNSVTQSTSKKNPANIQDAHIYQPVLKSTHRRPVSLISQARDNSRHTQNILPCNINPTPSTSRSAPKQHPSTTIQTNTSVFQNTPATSAPGHPVQSPQTQWYPPFLVDALTRELNTSSSNLASRNRNANRAFTAVNVHIAHPQTHSRQRPVEPHNERTERTAQRLAVRTVNNVRSLSNLTPIIYQRPTDNQRINTTQSSSNSEGRPNLFPRHQSRLLEQRPRPIQNSRTWHTPVHEPRTNN